ncbi:hypothetical protein E3N88_09456 [Mikania micrantha]|uniref:Uncharacterized protein n=1 Tax=Mikania micrantha TaxID=192012 RepID=A0A5N6PJ33_9ASTR|nr:hypothetical protein E3N88_09456 [Mikania micrantha]
MAFSSSSDFSYSSDNSLSSGDKDTGETFVDRSMASTSSSAGTEATSMNLKNPYIHSAIVMKGLRKMKKIRLLSVTNDIPNKWDKNGGVQYLPDTLRSLCWARYPFCCLPKTFQAKNLVNLEMLGSNISQLWKGGEREVE